MIFSLSLSLSVRNIFIFNGRVSDGVTWEGEKKKKFAVEMVGCGNSWIALGFIFFDYCVPQSLVNLIFIFILPTNTCIGQSYGTYVS